VKPAEHGVHEPWRELESWVRLGKIEQVRYCIVSAALRLTRDANEFAVFECRWRLNDETMRLAPSRL
jgi:hypothetical protein